MAIAKIEAMPKFDLGSELVPWEQRRDDGKALAPQLFLASRMPNGSRERSAPTHCGSSPKAIRDDRCN